MNNWILQNGLWIVGLGLMLSSSGIDGAYLCRIMPDNWQWLGLVLNSVADIAGLALTYFYGMLRRSNPKGSKRYKMSNVLLFAEAFAVLYSWFFSWLQLRIVMLPIEGESTLWIAPIAAFFVPGLLAFIGFAQSLMIEKADVKATQVASDKAQVTQVAVKVAQVALQPKASKVKVAPLNATAKAILQGYADNPDATKTEIAKVVEVSRTTVSNYVGKLKLAGNLREGDNGNGRVMEVIN